MYLDGASYGNWKFDSSSLAARVITVGSGVRQLMADLEADCVAVRGTSGVCMAWALAGSGMDFPIMLMRKDGENSHGSKFEGQSGHLYHRVLILDDFIASGATIGGMVRDLAAHAKLMGAQVAVVGLLLHQGADTLYFKAQNRGDNVVPSPIYQREFNCEGGSFPMYSYEEPWK